MNITVELLKEKNACVEQVELFAEVYPEGISDPTNEQLHEAAFKGLDVEWAAQTGLVTLPDEEIFFTPEEFFHEDGSLDYRKLVAQTYKNNRRHSYGGRPALTTMYEDPDQTVLTMTWYKEGEWFREHGQPAQVTTFWNKGLPPTHDLMWQKQEADVIAPSVIRSGPEIFCVDMQTQGVNTPRNNQGSILPCSLNERAVYFHTGTRGVVRAYWERILEIAN